MNCSKGAEEVEEVAVDTGLAQLGDYDSAAERREPR